MRAIDPILRIFDSSVEHRRFGNSAYLVSADGRVWSEFTHAYLVGEISLFGYRRVILSIDGVVRKYVVHRLVAMCFIPNPENKPEVNHKDGVKLNNNVWNLEWVTQSENHLHAYKLGLQDRWKCPQFFRPVLMVSPDRTIVLRRFYAACAADRFMGLPLSSIHQVCTNHPLSVIYHGYYWCFEDWLVNYDKSLTTIEPESDPYLIHSDFL